ncbi:MAG TPA: NAD-dependent epimerase/dehydratase family protein [Polyangiaceae bacterium]|nr:NAD-dependent epimerase/dehydratase family protein [Polyangiaceae bacterium]
MSPPIIVTGAAGFIGSHVAERLLERGERVLGVDNFNDYYSPERKRDNIAEVSRHPGFTLCEGDIRDRDFLERLFGSERPRAIAHLAAMAGVRASSEQPALYYDVNLNGTLNLLEAARAHGKPNFVFASTSSVYGNSPVVPFVETDNADRPLAPYPASKRSGELLGHAYHHLHGLDFTALRFFTVYGPRGRPDMLAHLVLDSMRLGRPMPLYNGGKMIRDWTFVGDIVSGVVAALDRRLGYEVINLGRGEPAELSAFVAELTRLSGKTANFVEERMNDADVTYTGADISKAQRLLGYAPSASIEHGTRAFFDWYVSHVGPFG